MRILTALVAFTSIITSQAFCADSESKSKKITITGKLNTDGAEEYRVAAIQSDGKSTIAKVSENKKFRFKLNELTAKNASMHVVTGAGRYLGPVVLAKGDKASTRLSGKSSGNLGNITVSSGFVQAEKKGSSVFSSSNKVDFDSTNGTPGSGNLGFVQTSSQDSNNRINLKADSEKPGNDTDSDGIPNLIDVDDDGDLILDSTDANFTEFQGARPYLFSDLVTGITTSVNANAQTVSQTDIDNFVKAYLNVVVGYNSSTEGDITSANVDCLGLPYCGSSGVATIEGLGGISLPTDFPVGSLWSAFDSDEDGFPNLYVYSSKTRAEIIINPNVDTTQIRAGDSLLFKILFGKKLKTYPLVLSFIFATVPAAKTVSDGTTTTTFTYPGTESGPGTSLNPINLASKSVTFSFWRPQRLPIEGAESGTLIEMGNLKYGVDLSVGTGTAATIVNCLAADYSGLSSDLSLVASDYGDSGIDVLKDSRSDHAPDSSLLLSFTLNLDTCITRAGLSSSAQTVNLGLRAKDRTGSNASQLISFVTP